MVERVCVRTLEGEGLRLLVITDQRLLLMDGALVLEQFDLSSILDIHMQVSRALSIDYIRRDGQLGLAFWDGLASKGWPGVQRWVETWSQETAPGRAEAKARLREKTWIGVERKRREELTKRLSKKSKRLRSRLGTNVKLSKTRCGNVKNVAG